MRVICEHCSRDVKIKAEDVRKRPIALEFTCPKCARMIWLRRDKEYDLLMREFIKSCDKNA